MANNPFAPARVDFYGMLSDIGKSLGEGIKNRRIQSERERIFSQDGFNASEAVKQLLAAGDTEGAKIAALSANRDTLTPYQRESLDLRRQDLALRANEPARQPSAIEGTRRKLAAGEPLSPGEQKVYDDALAGDPFMRAMIGRMGNDSPFGQQGDAVSRSPFAPRPIGRRPTSTGPKQFEADPQRRQLGEVYNLPDGRQALWTRDDRGNVGWELLN